MADLEALDPVLADLGSRVRRALDAAGLPLADPDFERPRQPEHGDWATSVALRLAKPARRNPREIAAALVEHLELPDTVASVDVAGPGFVNIRLAHRYFEDLVRRILAEGDRYGSRSRAAGERIDVEFVSSNPTGPLHAGHGRWAAAGDAIAALLEADGHEVDREYYVNDAGEQIRVLGESVLLAATGGERAEGHYRGDYIVELADEIRAEHGADLFEGADAVERVADEALPRMLAHIQATLHRLGVDFDVWFSERSLHRAGAIDAAVAQLREAGHVYDDEGATFLRTTTFGDDKDRVLVRSDGRPTYFAADAAYLRDKVQRGYDRLIYILGADHHGYVGRMQALGRCFGLDEDALEIRIGQNVNLLRGGEPVRMSTRAGEFVTLDEVIDEVGVDVSRYVYLRQSLDSPVDFDFEVVVEQSMENPVYYVQYAHARIASVVRVADDSGFAHGDPASAPLERLEHPAELELLRGLAQLPEVVADAAALRATQRVCRYAEDLAGSFHRFYTECRILPGSGGEDVDPALGRARYWLAVAARQVLANALGVLRVTAPERM